MLDAARIDAPQSLSTALPAAQLDLRVWDCELGLLLSPACQVTGSGEPLGLQRCHRLPHLQLAGELAPLEKPLRPAPGWGSSSWRQLKVRGSCELLAGSPS